MEELFVVILQVIFEIGLQVLAALPWDLFVGWNKSGSNSEPGPGLWVFLSLIAGGLLGGASLLLFPTTLLHWGAARIANLFLAPTVSGVVSFCFSGMSARGSRFNPRIRATCAAVFTLALALIRFTYATRPQP